MKLFILAPKDGNDELWGNYDIFDGFVVQAEDEGQARGIADENGADENCGGRREPWLSQTYTTCKELVAEGSAGVVLGSFRAG